MPNIKIKMNRIKMNRNQMDFFKKEEVQQNEHFLKGGQNRLNWALTF